MASASCCRAVVRSSQACRFLNSQASIISRRQVITDFANSTGYRRSICTTFVFLKKQKGSAADSSAQSASPTSSSTNTSKANQPDPENPLDFSALATAFAAADSHHKSQIQNISTGGRFNPNLLGSLPVNVKDDEGAPETYPLRELAQVVPRSGRNISLLVNDREYIKPIMSAVQNSKDFNQQPQRAEDNDLELLLKIEMERKDDTVKRIKEMCHAWKEQVRQARSKHEKVVKEWKKNGTLLPDAFKMAEKELQKLQGQKLKEIESEETRLIKQLDRAS